MSTSWPCGPISERVGSGLSFWGNLNGIQMEHGEIHVSNPPPSLLVLVLLLYRALVPVVSAVTTSQTLEVHSCQVFTISQPSPRAVGPSSQSLPFTSLHYDDETRSHFSQSLRAILDFWAAAPRKEIIERPRNQPTNHPTSFRSSA